MINMKRKLGPGVLCTSSLSVSFLTINYIQGPSRQLARNCRNQVQFWFVFLFPIQNWPRLCRTLHILIYTILVRISKRSKERERESQMAGSFKSVWFLWSSLHTKHPCLPLTVKKTRMTTFLYKVRNNLRDTGKNTINSAEEEFANNHYLKVN